MATLTVTLFVAGVLTILLPCILPLLPIVLGVSIADRGKLRPLAIVLGMALSFVGFTFALQVFLSRFAELADILRIATYYVLLLFGLGFLFRKRAVLLAGAVLGSVFFLGKGWAAVIVAAVLGCVAMELGGKAAAKIQQIGTDIQNETRSKLGSHAFLSPFLMGLTLGLVWVPRAGPALGFALALVREQPGVTALFLLGVYALGSAIPLLLIGYGGQAAVHSVRALGRYSEHVKKASGILLILSAIGFRLNLFTDLQTWISENTGYGTFANKLEESFFGGPGNDAPATDGKLPILGRAPLAFVNEGTWHNSEPLKLEDLRGKVVLIDFWTYSCINCIRTLPYVQGYQDKYKDAPFVLLGVHTPEFVFEKSEANVRDAVKRHGLTYAVAQDNDFGTWRAFANRYWPAKYLIDAEGYIRYAHFGEGAYDETDEAIASLLAEIGVTASGAVIGADVRRAESGRQSPETYLGERSWPALQNAAGEPTDDIVAYPTPEALALNKYALTGTWQLQDGERQTLISEEGEIRMRWLGGEINLVLGLAEGAGNATGEVFIDGTKVKGITVDRHDLFNLFTGSSGEHELVLKLRGKGVEGYAFTFGQGE